MIVFTLTWEKSGHSATPPLVCPRNRRLRNDRRNSILMTRHYPGARFSKGPPKNLSCPIARENFKIRSCWIAAQFLARKPVNFLCLLIVSIYHLQLWSWMQTLQHKTAFRFRKVAGTFEKRTPDLSTVVLAIDWSKFPSRHNQIRNNTLQIWVRRDTSVLISIEFLCSFH